MTYSKFVVKGAAADVMTFVDAVKGRNAWLQIGSDIPDVEGQVYCYVRPTQTKAEYIFETPTPPTEWVESMANMNPGLMLRLKYYGSIGEKPVELVFQPRKKNPN